MDWYRLLELGCAPAVTFCTEDGQEVVYCCHLLEGYSFFSLFLPSRPEFGCWVFWQFEEDLMAKRLGQETFYCSTELARGLPLKEILEDFTYFISQRMLH